MAYYSEVETACEFRFQKLSSKTGGIWHVCTPGNMTVSFNETREDYAFAVTNLAICAAELGVTVITDQVMSNHIHSILACTKAQCIQYVANFAKREANYFKINNRIKNLSGLKCDIPIPITSLQMLRNEIVYVNRNGYLADRSQTPFSYPWGGGSLYFNPYAQALSGIPANDITYKMKRKLTFKSAFEFPVNYKFYGGMIVPGSYVDYLLGQSFFHDAHQYFYMLAKNVESFSEIAKRLGDKVVLTDDEIYGVLRFLLKRDYGDTQVPLLPQKDRLDLAKTLHYDYHVDLKQLQRLLKLESSVLQELFPYSTAACGY